MNTTVCNPLHIVPVSLTSGPSGKGNLTSPPPTPPSCLAAYAIEVRRVIPSPSPPGVEFDNVANLTELAGRSGPLSDGFTLVLIALAGGSSYWSSHWKP